MKRTALEAEGLKIEPRLARALYRAQVKVRSSVPVYDLMVALQKALQEKNASKATGLITKEMIKDALKPAAKIIEDAAMKSAKMTAREINRRANGNGRRD